MYQVTMIRLVWSVRCLLAPLLKLAQNSYTDVRSIAVFSVIDSSHFKLQDLENRVLKEDY